MLMGWKSLDPEAREEQDRTVDVKVFQKQRMLDRGVISAEDWGSVLLVMHWP